MERVPPSLLSFTQITALLRLTVYYTHSRVRCYLVNFGLYLYLIAMFAPIAV
jgi:hypothetical protein